MPYILTIFLLGLSALSLDVAGHAGHRAYFTLQPDGGVVRLEVRVHDHDLTTALRGSDSCGQDRDRTFCASSLIQRGCSIRINNTPVVPILVSAARTASDDVLVFTLQVQPDSVRTVSIENTCFVKTIPAMESIVRFRFSKDVSYSMNKSRTRITHTL